jgi:ribonuclease Z
MLDILFLGTGASIPSRTRSLPCVAVRNDSDITVFDCGEGAQKQFMISPFSFMKVSSIFITHFHGDHILGLPGLLQTMGMSGRKRSLKICGPPGIERSTEFLLAACERSFVKKDEDPLKELEFPLEVVEMNPGDTVEVKGGKVLAFRTEHGLESLGYKFVQDEVPGRFDKEKALSLGLKPSDFSKIQNGETVKDVSPDMIIGPTRPGHSIVYTGDTIPCEGISEASMNADVLIHESTYSEKDAKLARENLHSTATDAAKVALSSNVRKLVLIHVSNRYDDLSELEKEASAIFENTTLAHDMMMLSISRSEVRVKPADE